MDTTYSQRRAVTGSYLQALTDLIEEERNNAATRQKRVGKPPHVPEWLAAAKHLRPAELALLIIDWATYPRRADDSRLTCVLDLGSRVAPADAPLAAIGTQLADLAHRVGLIEDLKPPLGKNRNTDSLRLTADALAIVERLREDIEAPIWRKPVTAPVRIKASWRCSEPPAAPSALVQQSADIVRATGWRVNQRMLAIAQRLDRSKLTLQDRLAIDLAAKLQGTFYLNGWFDWRGRYYSEGMQGLDWTGGSDLARSLLEFADGYTLTEPSAAYMEQSISALFGLTGKSDGERWDWFEANAQNMVKCSRGENDFHLQAKDSYQFLAGCLAVADYLDGKPIHLPCQWDVKCSGVGIYALLTRDKSLAHHMDLLPRDRDAVPPDFYTHFGNLCEPALARGPAKNYVKTAMYGSIISPLRSDGTPVWEETEKDRAFWTALGAPSKRLFLWLREWAAREEILHWSLPDGFTVTHDYRQEVSTRERVRVGRREIVYQRNSRGPGRDQKQAVAAICANFIQSYDAAVLRAAVRLGAGMGIRSFGVMHDCFAVPANFAYHLTEKDGALHMAYKEVFGADRLAEIGYPEKFGLLDWPLGNVVS